MSRKRNRDGLLKLGPMYYELARAEMRGNPPPDGLTIRAAINVDFAAMQNWPHENVVAFMRGVGLVISAKSAVVHVKRPAPAPETET